MTGAGVNIVGCIVGALALQAGGASRCFASRPAIIGIYNAVGLQYRFAAAEVAAPGDRARAISLVLAGGVVGGLVGPQATWLTRDLFATPFLGSFVVLAAFALVALAVQSRVRVPPPSHEERTGAGRPLSQIAAPAGVRRRRHCRRARLRPHESADDGDADRDELLRPSVRRGRDRDRMARRRHVCARLRDRLADPALRRAADHPRRRRTDGGRRRVALDGISVAHFVASLALVGIGWNFMYTGGTTLLTETYRPSEKARTQGLNDFIVFATMGVSSLSSGALVTTSGWETMNRAAFPVLALIVRGGTLARVDAPALARRRGLERRQRPSVARAARGNFQ